MTNDNQHFESVRLKASVIISATNTSGNQKLDAIMDLFNQYASQPRPATQVEDEYVTIPPQFVGDKSRKIKKVTATTYPKEKYFAVEYAGFWNIQEGQYYGDTNILDAEKVGEDVAEANAKLIAKLLNSYTSRPAADVSELAWDLPLPQDSADKVEAQTGALSDVCVVYKDFLESALNHYWNDAYTNLERKDLGDIERKNYEYQLSKSKDIMEWLSYLPLQDKVEDAVGFAEWIKDEYFYVSQGEWVSKLSHYSGCQYTTSELYQLYTESKSSQAIDKETLTTKK